MKYFILSISILVYSISFSQLTDIKNYIFGHSLIVHDPPLIPTPSDETSVPHWIEDIAKEANK
jgi:hypothetical protein